MKKCLNKRWMLLGSLVLVMVLATASFAISGFKSHFGRHHDEGFVKEKVLSHMDYTMQELKLTASQQVKYSAIRDNMSKAMDACMIRHNTAKNNLHTEMDRPQPDIKALAGTLKKEVSSIPETVNLQIDYMLEVYDILDKTQQDKLVQMFKEHMDRKDCS